MLCCRQQVLDLFLGFLVVARIQHINTVVDHVERVEVLMTLAFPALGGSTHTTLF